MVIGAGVAGLAAAWDLKDRDVIVLESTDRVGGRLMSIPRGEHWLNLGAHVFAGEDSAVGRLVAETGADELMIVSDVYDHQQRLRSFELIAKAGGITP